MKTVSPRQYAKHRSCALSTVQEALNTGRLRKSARKAKGEWQIDSAAADREWALSTHSDRAPLTGPTAPRAVPPASDDDGDANPLAEGRARLELAKAGLAELELAEALGRYVLAADVEAARLAEIQREKTMFLGIPSKLRQDDPTLTPVQLAKIEERIREALESASRDDEATKAA